MRPACPECGRRHPRVGNSDRCLADAGRATQGYAVHTPTNQRAAAAAERARYEAMKAYRREAFGADDEERPPEAGGTPSEGTRPEIRLRLAHDTTAAGCGGCQCLIVAGGAGLRCQAFQRPLECGPLRARRLPECASAGLGGARAADAAAVNGSTTLDELQGTLLGLPDRWGNPGRAHLQVSPPQTPDGDWSAAIESLGGLVGAPRGSLAQAVDAAVQANLEWERRAAARRRERADGPSTEGA